MNPPPDDSSFLLVARPHTDRRADIKRRYTTSRSSAPAIAMVKLGRLKPVT
jgi:hypothetical protein